MLTPEELQIEDLGPAELPSPLRGDKAVVFVDDGHRVLYERRVRPGTPRDGVSFEDAGPREKIYFDPAQTTAAVVTCGGLSPGLNNVIRGIVSELAHNYGVRRILGIRNGYRGLNPAHGEPPVDLDPKYVEDIHYLGGTVLGSSRGPEPAETVVDFLESSGIDILFCIGGDGTQRGAHDIAREVRRRGLPKSVIGIPKTIDNDIPFVYMTFGYMTALAEAEKVLRGAHHEAKGAVNGIAIVKLMGRSAGYIAAGASLASDEANFVLVPEVEFPIDGFLDALRQRMEARHHALIVVAEGAGQHLFDESLERRDASGNLQHEDIGIHLKNRIKEYFAARSFPVNVKYIDPSYVIRSVPANAWDRVLASQMARDAVHAAMAGKTDMLVGYWHGETVHVPLPAVVSRTKQLKPNGDMWGSVIRATGQPRWGMGA